MTVIPRITKIFLCSKTYSYEGTLLCYLCCATNHTVIKHSFESPQKQVTTLGTKSTNFRLKYLSKVRTCKTHNDLVNHKVGEVENYDESRVLLVSTGLNVTT